VSVAHGHTGPIKSVAWMSASSADEVSFATASHDFSLVGWKIDPADRKCRAINQYAGHTRSVECVASDPSFERFCSGSWDHTIKIWKPTSTAAEEELPEEVEGAPKRAKVHFKTVKKHSLRTLKEHTLCVSSITWPTPYNIFSGSWDHTLRQWDVETGIATRTLTGDKIVSSVSYSPPLGLLASGHNDKVVRLWDPRSSDAMVKERLISHSLWVSSVAWHPTKISMLVSGSHDGSIKVWDVRSRIPLHTLPSQHHGKVLCVAWDGSNKIVSGGADNLIKIHEVVFPE